MKPRILVWPADDGWRAQAMFGAIPGSLNGDEPHFVAPEKDQLLAELREYYGEFDVVEQPR